MTPERIAKLREVLDRRQPDLTVLTDFVHKGRNLSAIVRNCDAVGIAQMHAVVPDQSYKAFRGTAKGSHQWVKVVRHPRIEDALSLFKQQGFQIVAAHVDEATVDYREVDYTRPTALVMGAEKHGISDPVVKAADHFIKVPMVGMVESFNVSVAAGIILEEARWQREKAGLYQQRRIDQQTYDRLFFNWGYPKLAEFCHDKGIDYPPVNEQGDLLNPSQWYEQVRKDDTSNR